MPALENITVGDLLLVALLAAFAAWSWARGVPRRIVSLVATLVAVAIATLVRNPLGAYLGAEWTSTPHAYGYMVAFMLVFTVLLVAIAFAVEYRMGTYLLFPRAPLAEHIVGAALGVLQGLVLLAALALALDPYFTGDGRATDPTAEFRPLRAIDRVLEGSAIMGALRDGAIPWAIQPFRDGMPYDMTDAFPSPAPGASDGGAAPAASPAPSPTGG